LVPDLLEVPPHEVNILLLRHQSSRESSRVGLIVSLAARDGPSGFVGQHRTTTSRMDPLLRLGLPRRRRPPRHRPRRRPQQNDRNVPTADSSTRSTNGGPVEKTRSKQPPSRFLPRVGARTAPVEIRIADQMHPGQSCADQLHRHAPCMPDMPQFSSAHLCTRVWLISASTDQGDDARQMSQPVVTSDVPSSPVRPPAESDGAGQDSAAQPLDPWLRSG